MGHVVYTTVATAPSPADSGTSLVVAAGKGSIFPAVPFKATVGPPNAQPSSNLIETCDVTGISTDTLTLVRAQYGSDNREIAVGDRVTAVVEVESVAIAEAQIGEAPAAPAAFAGSTLARGSAAANADLTFTAKVATSTVVRIKIPAARAGTNTILVTVSGGDITIDRATTDGTSTSTATNIKDAIEADSDANALVSVAVEGTGAGLVDTFATFAALTGGTDNVPGKAGLMLHKAGILYFCTGAETPISNAANWKKVSLVSL